MKRLLLLISFAILSLHSFTQTDVQRDNRVSPFLKQALASKSGYYIYGRSGAAGFINIAVLNQSSHTLCWFTCHGRFFDSTKLTTLEFEQVTSKKLDPFVLYQNICDKYLRYIAAAKDIYRVYGDVKLFDKLNGNYRALFAMETVQAAKTPLQKIIAVENVSKKILTQLSYLNCISPFGLHSDSLYKISKELAGAMIQTKDSTVYYNIDPTSAVAKISLYKKSAGQLYVQNRFSEIIDSVAMQPGKYDLLQKEKTDVFLLYRGWLEMQWKGALSAIRRQSAGPYIQVNAQNEKEVKELYSQLNDIGAKINKLNSPEAKCIEQAVYDTYKNETSEISYIPLLGIGYSLTQTRGQKEYELTNHLGNMLATVSDKKIGVPSNSNSSLIDHYEPDIVSAHDYYPFGMLQPGRSYLSPNGDKYRYGFNGKENDNEVKGEGNQVDYGARAYDPRIGKFLSLDPLQAQYPELTPYQFASNSPIQGVDLDGREIEHYVLIHYKNQKEPVLKFLGEQTREFAWWEAFDKHSPATNAANANGAKINYKTIRVWEQNAESGWLGWQEGDDIGQYAPYRDFASIKELDAWKAAKFPAKPSNPVDPKLQEQVDALNTIIINELYFRYDMSDGEFDMDAPPDVSLVLGKSKLSPTAKVNEQTNAVNGVGAMRRLEYEAASYHGKVDNAVKSRGPVNGQDALDASVLVKETSPRRVGIDYNTGEFVVFDKTIGNKYHGHVRSWKDLHPDMQKALIKSKLVDNKGKILTQ